MHKSRQLILALGGTDMTAKEETLLLVPVDSGVDFEAEGQALYEWLYNNLPAATLEQLFLNLRDKGR